MNPNQTYTFNFPTTIRFGKDVIKELGAHLKGQGLKRPLIVTDPVLAGLPLIKNIVTDLRTHGLMPEVYSGIHKNPIKSDVDGGAVFYHECRSDALVGIGGGASLDVARAMAVKINHLGDLFDYDDAIDGWKLVTGDIPYFVTVPTTSGTGSEVGRSAVISDDVTHQKKIIFSPRLMAKIVFADPVLTMELPPHITAATGMDALTHNVEAYLAKGFHPMCDGIALEGIRLIAKNLVTAVTKPDLESRSMMLLAAMMGATAFQKGLGVVHSTAHPLSTRFDTHHGLANAIMISYGVEFNADVSFDRLSTIAKIVCEEEPSPQAFADYLRGLNSKIGLPVRLSSLGIKAEHLDDLAGLAFADFCHLNNPKPVTRKDFLNIYRNAL